MKLSKKIIPFVLISFLLFNSLQVSANAKSESDWQDEAIYFLMVDRFNNGDSNNDYNVNTKDPLSYHGGDFKGIIQQLDYIKDMGFTSILLSPIFDNEDKGYHGYWIKDYFEIEEHFGTRSTFNKLLKEAHNRDMKVLVEFPTLGSPQAEPNTELIKAAKWWVEETAIDGYKFVGTQKFPEGFWKAISEQLRKIKPEIFLIGDVESESHKIISSYSNTGLDSVLDYPGSFGLRKAFAEPNIKSDALFENMKKNKDELASPSLTINFIDQQNMERFTRASVEKNLHPGARWKLALTYLFTTPGIPMVYYGSEIALDGGEGSDNHKQMDFRTDKELVDYITKIGELRNKLPSLAKGTMTPIYSKNGMIVFKKEFAEEITVVAINNTTKSQTVTLEEEDLQADKELRGLLSEDLIKNKNGEYKLIIDRDEAEIYLLSEKSGVNVPYMISMGVVYTAFVVFIILLIRRAKRKKAE